jgi:hypothetical protein
MLQNSMESPKYFDSRERRNSLRPNLCQASRLFRGILGADHLWTSLITPGFTFRIFITVVRYTMHTLEEGTPSQDATFFGSAAREGSWETL